MHQFEVYFLPRLFPKIAKPIDINIKSSFKNVHPSADFPRADTGFCLLQCIYSLFVGIAGLFHYKLPYLFDERKTGYFNFDWCCFPEGDQFTFCSSSTSTCSQTHSWLTGLLMTSEMDYSTSDSLILSNQNCIMLVYFHVDVFHLQHESGIYKVVPTG